ncbi:hypothetical protein PRIPAC_97086 [Pristionchus pacificus]|uniref:Uncharacterized protein n=1 Tax=Pristionchus pacificus TaxID=54126 RepID=A0A454XUC6_PRIPA|nr:hypothetical protein PRIPAC_97086 [Pristionchus pacificus]|eukprot:PDM84440.1 hypothetical protein PRIPAC_33463 [Pristionchus pacificus]
MNKSVAAIIRTVRGTSGSQIVGANPARRYESLSVYLMAGLDLSTAFKVFQGRMVVLGDLDTNGELTIRFLVGSITPSHTATDLTRVIRCHGGAMEEMDFFTHVERRCGSPRELEFPIFQDESSYLVAFEEIFVEF